MKNANKIKKDNSKMDKNACRKNKKKYVTKTSWKRCSVYDLYFSSLMINLARITITAFQKKGEHERGQ